MDNEIYWSKFADDFEHRANYIVGKNDVEIIKGYLAKQKSLGNVLELGCGNGTYSEILISEAEHLTATDFSDEMVAVSSKRFKDVAKVTVEKANCFSLSYPDSSFDTVLMANLLHIIPEQEKAIEESKRALTKNGRLIILSLTTEGMNFFAKIVMIYRYLKSFGKPSPTAQTLTVKRTQEMLKKCGLEIEDAKLIGNKSKAIFIKAIANKI